MQILLLSPSISFFSLCFFKVVPHVTNAIQEWVERVAKIPVDGDELEPEVCIVEVRNYVTDSFLFGCKLNTVRFSQ